MDKRTLRSKKVRPRNARQYDRPNQGLFGKVYSTMRGILQPPSWILNSVSSWIGNSEERQPDTCLDIEEETVREDNDVVSQSVSHGNKRLRLRFDDNTPSIQSSATQTWTDQPSQNLYDTISHAQTSTAQSSLLENKESIAVLNGDDHSENSEGSASTSGCSSLVSSHKDTNRVVESPFHALRSELKSRKRKEPSTKSELDDLNSSINSTRTLWSRDFSPSSKFQRRLPTISHTNQPSFNLSTFVGPSKLNESLEKKISSPFYEGRTKFGGASALRRMPPSVTPYQVDKTLRNQIKVRTSNSEDNLEGMSSAAKRILLTLEKMSTPIADAKKIPNTKTSPVDLSVYLTPPKSRRNSQFTPTISSKGPPLANINTIAKLTTLKNYGINRLRNSLPGSPSTYVGQEGYSFDNLQPRTSPETIVQKSGGGKIKNKLNQHHQSSKDANGGNEVLEIPDLPRIPLPISKLPTISFGNKVEKPVDNNHSAKSFTFSNPIEHDLTINNTVSTSSFALPSSFDSKFEKNSDLQPKPFVFSSPIEHELPSNTGLPKENVLLPMASSTLPGKEALTTWKCNDCWVQNTGGRTSCIACEAPKVPKETSAFRFKLSEGEAKNNSVVTTVSVSSSTAFSFAASSSSPAFTFGTSKTSKSVASNTDPLKVSESNASTWECASCWVRNPEKESKCVACENPRPNKNSSAPNTKVSSSNAFSFAVPSSSPAFTFGTPKTSKSITTNTFSLKTSESNASLWECASCWVRNPEKESKCVACETPRPKKISSSTTEVDTSSVSTTTSTTWECSACWVRNPAKETKCLACESPCSLKEGNEGLGSTSVENTSEWKCNCCWVKNPGKESKCRACEAVHLSKDNAEIKSTVSSVPSSWECSSCWVRNPMKEKKCMACETLHPDADQTSGMKNTSGFKFSSPVQNSPITFKFGNYVCTAPSTDTTSTFKFGIASNEPKTTSSTGFKFGNSCTSTSSFFSSSSFTAADGTKIGVGTANFGSNTKAGNATENNSLTAKNIPNEDNTGTSKDTFIESNAEVSKDTGNGSFSVKTSNISEKSRVSSETNNQLLENKSSENKVSDSVITSTSSEPIVSKAKEVPAPSVTACFSFTTQPLLDSKKTETFPFGTPKEKLTSQSLPSPFSIFPTQPSNAEKSSEGEKSVQSETKNSNASSENKVSSTFQFTSQPQQVSSAFTTLASAPVFKFGVEKADSNKINLSSTSTAMTTVTTSSFSFGNNTSNYGFTAVSKGNEISSISSETITASTKADDVKVSSATTISSAATTSSFVFGSTVTTAAPSGGFSFFPSSSTTATTVSSVFTFGVSSSTAQSTKPSGFTFKGIENSQSVTTMSSLAPISSTSQSTAPVLSIGSSAPVPSGGFVFGTPKTEAQTTATAPFAFGSGAVSSSSTPAFSAFQPSQSAAAFQFGSQPTGSTASTIGSSNSFAFAKSEVSNQVPSSVSQNPAPAFGSSTSNFVFGGTKNETSNQIPSTVSQAPSLAFGSSTNSFSFINKTENTNTISQNPNPTFGSSMPSGFGNASVPTPFGSADKPTFNFGGASTSGVFQFGASNNTERKRTATASGFTFGTPAASEQNSSFQPNFNMNTPPSFNFGATSTPAGPALFQFAASSAPKSAATQNAPRKYRKALRRVRKD